MKAIKKAIIVVIHLLIIISGVLLLALFMYYKKPLFIYIVDTIIVSIIIFLSMKNGKLPLVYLRGIYWRILLKKCGNKLRVGEKVQFLNPKYKTIGNSCDIKQNAEFALLGKVGDVRLK